MFYFMGPLFLNFFFFLRQWFSTWVSFAFFVGSRELLINVFLITSIFYISYIEPLFAVAKIIGLPVSSIVNHFCSGWASQ